MLKFDLCWRPKLQALRFIQGDFIHRTARSALRDRVHRPVCRRPCRWFVRTEEHRRSGSPLPAGDPGPEGSLPSARRSDVVVLHGAGDEAGGGVRAPVVDVEGSEVAEDGGQRLELRPVVGELGAEPREAVGHFAALRRAPDRVEGVADEAAPPNAVSPRSPRLNSEAVFRRVRFALPVWTGGR